MPAAVCLVGGILAGRLVGFESRELYLLIVAFAGLAVAAYAGRSARLTRVCLGFAVLFAGAWLERIHRPGPPPVIETLPREVLLLSGCVVEPPAFYPDRATFTLELEPGARVRVSLYPRPGQPAPALDYGRQVEVEARIRPVRNFGNPGAFDRVGFLARRQIYWTATVPSGGRLRLLPGRCGNPLETRIYELRAAILSRIDKLYEGRAYETQMMQALVAGDRAGVDEQWTEPFRVTGTYHALVISGLHLGVMATVLTLLLRTCMLSENAALLLASVFGWGYACLTGWQTPIVRAATGLTLYFFGRYLYRRTRPLNLLAAIAILVLVLDPEQLFEASFQLSFLSVASLGAIALPLIERTSAPYRAGLSGLSDRGRDLHLPPKVAQFRVELRLLAETGRLLTGIPEVWLIHLLGLFARACFYCYDLALVSAAVQLGLTAPMAILFHRLSFSGLTANLAVVPLITLALPLGLLAVTFNSTVLAAAAAWFLQAAQQVVDWHARWQPEWRVPDPPLWLVVALAASVLILAGLLGTRSRWRGAAAAVCLGLILVLFIYPFAPQVAPGELEFAALDVGQGDALFLALPHGTLMTVDAGGVPGFADRRGGFDTGEDVVSPYLWSRRIKRLDVVAISHFHEDHAGGVPALIRNFRPKEVWTGPLPEGDAARAVLAAARETGASVRRLYAGEIRDLDGVRFHVLAPPPEHLPLAASDRDTLVLHVTFGDKSFLLAGDLDPKLERMLVSQGSLPRATVLKVPHHGSRRSTTTAFLEQLQPSVGVISVGFENAYGHPHAEVLERLAEARVTALRTDLWGLIRIRTGGKNLTLDTYRWGEDRRAPLLGRD